MSQLGKRHLRLTLEIVRALAKREFDGSESSILNAIIIGTYGTWDPVQKEVLKAGAFSQQRLMDETGLSRSAVHRGLESLVLDRVVRVYREPGSHRPGVYGIESHPEKWLRPARVSVSAVIPNYGITGDTQTASRVIPNSVSGVIPKTRFGDTQTESKTGTTKPFLGPVDHVDLPTVVVNGVNDHPQNGSFHDPIPAYNEVLRPVSPIPFNRSARESAVLADYVALTDWSEAQKLDALTAGVAETKAYLKAKKGASGPVVCWAVEKATQFLATLDTELPDDEPEVNEPEGPDWWSEPQRLWEERRAKEQADLSAIGRDINDLEEPHGT